LSPTLPPLPPLPITEVLPELRAMLQAAPNVVLEAPPGAGKSTVVPLALLDEAWLGGRRILLLQPRRIAARAVARRMAQLTGSEPGQLVGYRTRLESRVGATTRIEVVTEGILTRMLQADPALEQFGCVIFDEFHERNLQSDLGLALSLDAQANLRDDLRLLVMSATLAGIEFGHLAGNFRLLRSQGRMFDVTTHHVAPLLPSAGRRDEPIDQRAARVTLRALAESPGDALVFLPGAAEIRRTVTAISDGARDPSLLVLPLFGELEAAEQDTALRAAPPGKRKVVVATNIAETSLTIEGVRIVVDAGLERRQRFDPNSGMSRLETVAISRAAADQRRGRAGRTAPGVCYRLWSASAHAALAAQAPPEILVADLTPLALDLATWGCRDAASLAWLDAPPGATLAQAHELLRRLDAIDAAGKATADGQRMAALATHPRLAHMIVRATTLGLRGLACEIAALLSERDPLRTPPGQRDPDLRHRLDVLHGAAAPPGCSVDTRAVPQVRRSLQVLERQAARLNPPRTALNPAVPPDEAAGLLLAFAYPDRIGLAREPGTGRYLLSNARGGVLPGPSALARSEVIVAADIDAGEREARLYLAAPLGRQLLETHLAYLVEERTEIVWDPRSETVLAHRERRLGALVLADQPLREAPADQVREAMLQGIRALGLRCLPWTPELEQWRQRVLLLRKHTVAADGTSEWPDVGDEALLATLDDWLAPWLDGVTRRDRLSRLDLRGALHGMLDWHQRRRLDELAPTHLVVPSGSRIAVDYTGGAPALAVRLQEVFGWMDSPRIAGGKVPVTLELLSPARRPVQVTRDLASFWARGYVEVRKELKGRYPKHYWPDDPYAATATRKVRPA
jgi:ATP-dependent helicase HrpB